MVSLTRPNSRPTHVYSSVRQGQILLKMLSFSPFLFSTLVSCPLISLLFFRFSHQFPDHDTYVRNSNALWLVFPAERELLQQELKKPREDFLSSMTITRLTTILGTIIKYLPSQAKAPLLRFHQLLRHAAQGSLP